MDGQTIQRLFGGGHDNSHEPEPLVNKRSTILSLVISFQVISWLFVGFRLHTRARVVKSLGWDDFFVVLSLLSITTGTTGVCVATKFGMGKHMSTLSSEQIRNYLLTFYVANGSYQMSTAFIKISLLFQYLRIFDTPCFLRKACIATIVFIGLWATPYSILGWIPCYPIYAYWDWRFSATRWAYGSLDPHVFFGTYASHATVNVFLDLVVLAIPVPLYFRRHMPLKSKLGLLFLLTIGLVVNGISVVRLVTLIQHRAATYPTLDFTWYAPISIVLSCIEVDLAMVASSVPIFWPVLRRFRDGIFVTKEIEVTRETRRLDSIILEDDMELEPDRRSRVGSEASLRQDAAATVRSERYADEFVLQQVDPLSKNKAVVTQVKAGDEVDSKWWQKGGS
ncbi:uncharacterized protein CTRU02_214453 [Colletotrichum truncatum]|uniref:Uncharacterized protein n=1 Tax=Colletotrichum truncatum TaxID=5467 RepID=A0ACC3YES3_COLTU|nr:uncharacterized protein CTRU02_12123 [Colletotrichum truncatum]KAF6784912.1 hypothetical protein CTRU02_12123 [Colletotrichum truncatum]